MRSAIAVSKSVPCARPKCCKTGPIDAPCIMQPIAIHRMFTPHPHVQMLQEWCGLPILLACAP